MLLFLLLLIIKIAYVYNSKKEGGVAKHIIGFTLQKKCLFSE